jgi:pimeloyl-ACP methyl ester carboxylesterase
MTVVQSRETLFEFKDWFRRTRRMADQEYLSRLADNYAFSFDVEVLAEPFDHPALIVTGQQDSAVGYRDAWEIVENYPRATFAVLDRAGHPLIHEQTHLLQLMVDEWLDRVEENTAS